jgi:hypothetical protein
MVHYLLLLIGFLSGQKSTADFFLSGKIKNGFLSKQDNVEQAKVLWRVLEAADMSHH